MTNSFCITINVELFFAENLLSCDNYNAFWVSWNGQNAELVRIGRGSVNGQNIIMEYRNLDAFHITGLSVASKETNSSDWQFGRFTGT